MSAMVEAAFTRGAILGRKYTLGDVIAEGPTGAIFSAEERFRAQRVAVKVVRLPPSMRLRQFMRDTEAAQAVRSENVTFVYDVGVEGDTPYVVMEWLEGKNLAALAAEYGPFPVGEAVGYVLQACNGLKELHAARVVHRHVKPSNLFLTKGPDGGPLVKLLDVGLSSMELALEAGDAGDAGASLDALKFAAPERLLARPRAGAGAGPGTSGGVDARTDVWSLAVTLYVLVTGKHPFDGATATEVREAIAKGTPTQLRAWVPEVAPELERVLERALAKAPEERTASIADFARALEPFATPPSVSMEAVAPPREESAPPESVISRDAHVTAVAPIDGHVDATPILDEHAASLESPVATAPVAPVAPVATASPPSVPPPSVQADSTAPGATTPVTPTPTALSASRLASPSRRWLALAAAAVLLLAGIVSRLGRSPEASGAPPVSSEPQLAREAPAEPRSVPSEAPAPPPVDEEAPVVSPALATPEIHDAGAPVPSPRRSRRR